MSEAEKLTGPKILSKWIWGLKRQEDKEISLIQQELGDAVGVSSETIYKWRQGSPPSTLSQAITLAEEIARRLSDIRENEFCKFLNWTGHSYPEKVWNSLFAKIEGPPADEFNIFIGREEVNELRNVLQAGRVVLLWGPGGVGKSSLVREVIQKLAPNNTRPKKFPDGIIYYDFYGPEHNADSALRHIADFFEDVATKDLSPRDAVSKALEDKKALIVLDRAEEADDLRKVLRIRHQCGILIVSRYEYLDLSNETMYLDILSPEQAIAVLRAWSTHQENDSNFQVWGDDNNEEKQRALEICEELGRLPLALRLAGRYMLYRRVNLAKFLELWRVWRLGLLKVSPYPHEHDSLQVLMEKSLEQVEQFSEGTREVMTVAGFLSYQPFTTEVIAASLEKSMSMVEKLLHDLWKFSLIVRVSSERWQITHQLVHAYTQDIGITPEITARLARYYTTFYEEHGQLSAELAHIVNVVSGCVVRQQWTEVLQLAWAMDNSARLELQEPYFGDAVLYAGIAAAQALHVLHDEALFLLKLGNAYVISGRGDQAVDYYQKAQQCLEQVGDLYYLSVIYHNIGDVYLAKDEWEKGLEFFLLSSQTKEQLKDVHDLAQSYKTLSFVYQRKGKWDEAIAYYQKALQGFEQLGDLYELASTYERLGHIYQLKGEWNQAITHYQKAIQDFERIERIDLLAKIYEKLGNVHLQIDEQDEAITHYQKARQYFEQLGEVYYLTHIYGILGNVYLGARQMNEAMNYFRHWITLDPEDAFEAHVSMGTIALWQGQTTEAQNHFEIVVNMSDKLEKIAPQSGASLLENRAFALLCLGQVELAVATLQTALDQYHFYETIKFTRYDLLADAPTPLRGLAKMRELLEKAVKQSRG